MTDFTTWTNKEIDPIIADYFAMLEIELSGKPLNKKYHRTILKSILDNRSDGSIEFKHQNISAVLIRLGLPYINGYKPRWNYQQALETRIIEHLAQQKSILEPQFLKFAESSATTHGPVNFNSFVDIPPAQHPLVLEPSINYSRRPIKINYLEREQANSAIGQSGEELVLAYEKWRLINLGKDVLADRVEWISLSDDGAGFDILSRNENGTDRYIEVKTTKLSKETPIFFSRNEYLFSLINEENYHLYRLFNFMEAPKMFNVNGSFDKFCTKEPIQYKGYF